MKPEKFRQDNPQMQCQTILGAMEGEILNNESGISPSEKTIERFSVYLKDIKNLVPWIAKSWNEEITVEKKHSEGMSELWVEWFHCPKCENSNIVSHSKYCSECGIKLIWNI